MKRIDWLNWVTIAASAIALLLFAFNLGALHANSPTMDRINPKRGYVKGNVMVISYKANSMKQDVDFATVERLYKALKQLHEDGIYG